MFFYYYFKQIKAINFLFQLKNNKIHIRIFYSCDIMTCASEKHSLFLMSYGIYHIDKHYLLENVLIQDEALNFLFFLTVGRIVYTNNRHRDVAQFLKQRNYSVIPNVYPSKTFRGKLNFLNLNSRQATDFSYEDAPYK